MAKTWYFAKCDRCMEVGYIMVKSLSYSMHMLDDQKVFDFMNKHHGCELTLGWRDDQMDKLWDEGYENRDIQWNTSEIKNERVDNSDNE